jgi:hypothetical protein
MGRQTGNNIPTDTPAQSEVSQHQEVQTPDIVKLDRNDPEFATRRELLKKSGYKWDNNEMVWRRQAA